MNDSCSTRVEQLLAMACLAFSLIGCASSPSSTFYLLSPTAVAESETGSAEQANCIHLRIAPVKFPEYLNRPHIVTRNTENKLTLADYDRWAEPLSDTFARVLAENISRQICTRKVSLSQGKALKESDYRVDMEVYRMDGILGKEAVLEAWWTVSGGAGNTFLRSKRSRFSEPVNENTYGAFVQAQSRVLAALSREIAEAIKYGSNHCGR